ncbi:tyrosine-type recombinase/integrase [Levilactobacillus namurensis]|uniref:tyrosine-type recombinase/integrase n=1 Tax=Levilactobacillus namurensis TaxID=380393 RepID=UPI0026ED29FB|nr:site-specific integrase [Levilactobacillus namurensis]
MRDWKIINRHPGVYEYATRMGKRYGTRRKYTTMDHRRKEWSKSGFMTWREADNARKKFEADLGAGLVTGMTNPKTKMTDYFESMVNRNIELKIWRINTVKQKESYWNTHLKPVFGDRPIDQVTRQEYQKFIDSKVKAGYARNTIVTINSVMQIVMNDASLNDVIPKNRLKGVSIEGAKRPAPKDLSEDGFNRFVARAKERYTPYQYGMIILLTLGERREELLGLRFNSFKFFDWHGEDVCAIKFDLGRTRYTPEGGELKNDPSYRTIYVRDQYYAMCKYMIIEAKKIYDACHVECTEDSFLIVNQQTAMPVATSYPNRLITNVANDIGEHITPHILRHYFATMAMTNGQVDTDVMHWLGHSSLGTTQSYTRGNIRGAMNLFDGMSKTLLGRESDK